MSNSTPARSCACEICGRRVYSGARGRVRTMHPECKPLADALHRLEKHLTPAGLAELDMTPEALADLRYRVFLITTEVPRPRYPKGHAKAGQFIPARR